MAELYLFELHPLVTVPPNYYACVRVHNRGYTSKHSQSCGKANVLRGGLYHVEYGCRENLPTERS